LIDAMVPFGNMDVRDCINSKEWWKALCDYAGMSDEKFNEILNGKIWNLNQALIF
jgi:hypothetical protein